MAFNSMTSSLALLLVFLLLSPSQCLAHYCKCECNMKKNASQSSSSGKLGSQSSSSSSFNSSSNSSSSHQTTASPPSTTPTQQNSTSKQGSTSSNFGGSSGQTSSGGSLGQTSSGGSSSGQMSFGGSSGQTSSGGSLGQMSSGGSSSGQTSSGGSSSGKTSSGGSLGRTSSGGSLGQTSYGGSSSGQTSSGGSLGQTSSGGSSSGQTSFGGSSGQTSSGGSLGQTSFRGSSSGQTSSGGSLGQTSFGGSSSGQMSSGGSSLGQTSSGGSSGQTSSGGSLGQTSSGGSLGQTSSRGSLGQTSPPSTTPTQQNSTSSQGSASSNSGGSSSGQTSSGGFSGQTSSGGSLGQTNSSSISISTNQGSSNSSGQTNSSSISNSTNQDSSNGGQQSTSYSTGAISSQSSISGSAQISLQFGFNASFDKIIAFGDSFTDTGNAGLLGGLVAFAKAILPGSPYAHQPALRFCNGRLLVDFLTEVLHLPHLPPYKNSSADFSKGVNFAVGGSTAFNGTFFDNNNVSRTLVWKLVPDCVKQQLDWFQQFLNNNQCKGLDITQCKLKLAKGLFWVGELAFNDYFRNFGTSITINSLMEKLIEAKCSLVKTLVNSGAKYIVLQGLPPLGCFPLQMSMSASGDREENGCVQSLNSIVKAHNDLLLKKIGEMKVQFPNCFIIYADFWNAFLTILKNTKQYGFEEPFKACCGAGAGMFNFNPHCLCGSPGSSQCQDPSKYISWDGIHFTEAMNSKLAELLFHQNFCRPAFKQIVSAAGQD